MEGYSLGVGRPLANVSVFHDFHNLRFDYSLHHAVDWLVKAITRFVGKVGVTFWFITKIKKYSRLMGSLAKIIYNTGYFLWIQMKYITVIQIPSCTNLNADRVRSGSKVVFNICYCVVYTSMVRKTL